MKLAVSSDWHLDAYTMGISRFPELRRAVKKSVEHAIAEKVDGYIFAGDLCDPDSGSTVFAAIELLIEVAIELRKAGVPFVAIAGNHDVFEDGSGGTTLSPLKALAGDGWIYHFSQPGECRVLGGQRLFALPYTATSNAYDVLHVLEREVFNHSARTVLVGHLSIPGMVPGEETHDMPRGREILLPLEEVLEHPKTRLVINGHYHRRHIEGKLVIPGSMARLTHGEESNEPGYLIIEGE